MHVCVCVIKDNVDDDQELYNYLYNTLGKSRYCEMYMGFIQFQYYCNIYIIKMMMMMMIIIMMMRAYSYGLFDITLLG